MVEQIRPPQAAVTLTLCVGEALIDFVSQSQLSDVGSSEFFRRAPGGAVANVAVGIARLGGRARFAGTLSRDSFGRFLLRTLAHENVNVDGVRIVDEATSLAFVARGKAGARDFVFVRNPGADSMLEAADVDAAQIEQARILHFGGVLLAADPARSACLAAAASASREGKLVSFDPNARPALFESRDEMKRWLRAGFAAATLIKLSEDDLREIDMTLSDARSLLNTVTRAVIVTRGALGACWMDAKESGEVRAPRIDPIDTTGAGDAATAAILWRLAQADGIGLAGEILADATRYACAAGAVACLREGAMPSLPTQLDIESMLPRLPP